MKYLRWFSLMFCVGLFVSSCATSGPSNRHITAYSLPICKNATVTNAPSTNSNGHIAGYKSKQSIKGVSLLTNPIRNGGCLSSGFGRRKGGAGSTHKGIDIATRGATPIQAAGDGKISFIGRKSAYGRLIIITHSKSVSTRYAHLSAFSKKIKEGQKVKAGTIIGRTGKTGNATGIHLHYEILVKGTQRNPLRF